VSKVNRVLKNSILGLETLSKSGNFAMISAPAYFARQVSMAENGVFQQPVKI
jgi:hypothetical protein